jgi:hypothetical protein
LPTGFLFFPRNPVFCQPGFFSSLETRFFANRVSFLPSKPGFLPTGFLFFPRNPVFCQPAFFSSLETRFFANRVSGMLKNRALGNPH